MQLKIAVGGVENDVGVIVGVLVAGDQPDGVVVAGVVDLGGVEIAIHAAGGGPRLAGVDRVAAGGADAPALVALDAGGDAGPVVAPCRADPMAVGREGGA